MTVAIEGRRIVLTRTAEDCAGWADRLAALGAHPVIFPCIERELIDTPGLRDAVARQTAAADWLVFTSRRGVEAVTELGGKPGRHCRLAGVGARTADAIETAYRPADLVGRGTAAALADELVRACAGDAGCRVVVAVAENAGTVIEDRLTAAGIRCTRLSVYRTVPAAPGGAAPGAPVLGGDVVWLASPSAVTGFVNRIDAGALARRHAPTLVAIGPSTAAEIRARGLDVAAEAREPSLEGMLEAMQCLN